MKNHHKSWVIFWGKKLWKLELFSVKPNTELWFIKGKSEDKGQNGYFTFSVWKALGNGIITLLRNEIGN